MASLPSDPATTIACVGVRVKAPGRARISFLAVSPSAQGGGIGRQVVAEAEAYCKKTWAVTTMELNALSERHMLMEWYGRQGYTKTGKSETDLIDGVHLTFIMMDKAV